MTSRDVRDFLALYQQVVFLLPPSFVVPQQFAIVTAYNPLGACLEDEENVRRNRQLESSFGRISYQPLVGCSLDLSHQEPSFALVCPKSEAIQLARRYDQNAIYWVTKDKLYLLPVMLNIPTKYLGRFSDYCR